MLVVSYTVLGFIVYATVSSMYLLPVVLMRLGYSIGALHLNSSLLYVTKLLELLELLELTEIYMVMRAIPCPSSTKAFLIALLMHALLYKVNGIPTIRYALSQS